MQECIDGADSLSREDLISRLEEKYEEYDQDTDSKDPNLRYMSGLTDYRDISKYVENLPGVEELPESYPDTEIEDIFTFRNDHLNLWTNDGYQENLEVSIIWTKADGTVVPISNQIIEFTRNELTTVTINLKEDSTNTDIEMEMEDGDIQPGEEIVINNVN